MRKSLTQQNALKKCSIRGPNCDHDDKIGHTYLDTHEDGIFTEYGYGVVAYFDLLWSLIKLFFVFFIISGIQVYHNVNGSLSDLDTNFNVYDTTVSNTGYSYALRVLAPLTVPKLTLMCERTFIQNFTGEANFNKYVGIIPNTMMNEVDIDISDPNKRCKGSFIKTELLELFANNCINKTSCVLENFSQHINTGACDKSSSVLYA